MNPPPLISPDDAAARARLVADRQIRHLDRVLLTAEEEHGLARLVRAGGDALPAGHIAHLTGERRHAADALLLHNTRLVAHIARSHLWTGLEFDDLRSHGILGLIRAVERFDPAAGTRFSTYATWWIRQSIRRAAANESRPIREPVHVFERRCKVAATEAGLSVDGSVPAIADVAEASGLTAEDVREAVSGLPARQAEVVRRRFGLDADRETLEQVGRHLGITKERVRQVQSVALAHLRRTLAEDLNDSQVA